MRSHASGNRPRRLWLVSAVAAAAAVADGETLWLDVLGGSAGVLDAPGHAAGAVVFADMDADGEEDVVAIEATSHRRGQATISRWSGGGRTVEGTFGWLDSRHRMLVGNLAGDATPELVLFSTLPPRDRSPTRIVQWDGSGHLMRKFDPTGRLGALADFDGDGVAELVFATPTLADALPIDPVELRAYAFTGEVLRLRRRLRLEHGVAALAAGDFDGDGGDELVTVEISRWDGVTGLLGVYGASETGFHSLFRKNRVLRTSTSWPCSRAGASLTSTRSGARCVGARCCAWRRTARARWRWRPCAAPSGFRSSRTPSRPPPPTARSGKRTTDSSAKTGWSLGRAWWV